MIQRLQTIYLLLITVLMVALFFLPLGIFSDGTSSYLLTVCGYKSMGESAELVVNTWPLAVLATGAFLLSFISIFLYKKRKTQITLSNIGSLLIFLFYLAFIYYAYDFKGDSDTMNMEMKPALIIPLLSLVLYYAAIRKIKSDEALVRSLDRLR